MLNLKIVVGSTRDGRAADLVVPWLVRRAAHCEQFTVDVLDLRDWSLPMFGESFQTIGNVADPTYSQPVVRRWNDAIGEADAVAIVTPEYNHSLPGVLKNALDTVFASFALRNKPVALVGYSGGPVGGARAVEHLAHVLIEAEAVPLRNSVLIASVHTAFADGAPASPATDAALDVLLDDLAWWGRVLADARPTALPPALLRARGQQPQRAVS